MKDRDIQWVTARVTAIYPQAEWKTSESSIEGDGTPIGSREVAIGVSNRVETNVFRRENLAPGQRVPGPAIIEQLDTTTYIAPEWDGKQDTNGFLWLRRATR